MKKHLKPAIKILITLGFLVWIFFSINWPEVWIYLISIDFWKLLLYAILILLGIAISSYKWKLLAEHKGIRLSFGDYYRFYLSGAFINNFMPSFIGGDTFRAYQIGKEGRKYIEAASSVLADRITGFIGMTILALLFSLLNIQKTISNNLLILLNSVLILSIVIDIMIAKTRNAMIWKKILEHLPQKIARFIMEVQNYSGDHKIMSKTILWGILFQFVGVALANLVLFWSLDIKINVTDYLSVIFLINLISSIPISINNIGIKEWAYVTFFGIYGLPSSAVITVAIMGRIIQMLISFLALPTYLKSQKHTN